MSRVYTYLKAPKKKSQEKSPGSRVIQANHRNYFIRIIL
jgi:hypothetical protein